MQRKPQRDCDTQILLYTFKIESNKHLIVMMAGTDLKSQSLSEPLQQEYCYSKQLMYIKVKPKLWTFTYFDSFCSVT